MSIYGAMFSGVSGLNANSQALGAIADNITNVNTIGYKATEVRFSTLVTAQAGLNNYSPGGVQQKPFAAVDAQGLFQSSTNATDLGISGDGFFVVNEENAHDGSTGFKFTRAGAFNADKSGYLKNTAGYYLQGYKTNSLGQTVDANNASFNPDPTVFTNLETIRLNNIGGTADATDNLTFGANLPAEAAIGATNNTTIQVYDSLGVAHNMQLNWTKIANNQWDLAIAPPTQSASAILKDSGGSIYASAGRLDFASQPADGDTIIVNSLTYEFDTTASGSAAGVAAGQTITIGSSISNTVSNLVEVLDVSYGGSRFAQNSSDSSRVDITGLTAQSAITDANDLVDGGGVMAVGTYGTTTVNTTLTFTANATDGDVFVFDAKTYEFDSGGAIAGTSTYTVTIGASAAATAANLVTAINANTSNTRAIYSTVSGTGRVHLNSSAVTDITFNASGTANLNQSGAGAVTINDVDLVPSATAAVTFDGSGIPSGFNVDDITMDLNNGAADLSVDFDFGTIGQATGLVQFAAAYNPTFIDTDGAAFGQFSGVTISEAGLVTALFENGDIRPIFKIPVATFPNPNGLGANSGNVYTQTDFSGLFFLRTPGSGGAGKIQNSVLEASTVDIAREFTNMITTQRAYSASAKIISTADEMLDELVRIKR
ncbi:MAG: flagellar hook-basal body complex protein [Rhodospirillales bacterium]|nr:flagellar hook-basal body complex protein [Rhodospirillales bacterium]